MTEPVVKLDSVGRAVIAAQRFDARLGLILSDLQHADLADDERLQVIEAARLSHENAARLVAAVGGRSSFQITPGLGGDG